MAILPQSVTQQPTLDAIYRAYEQRADPWPRQHLGASVIGRECDRALWYGFRWVRRNQFEGRLLRLFDRGQREEAVFIADLRAAGVTVTATDPKTALLGQLARAWDVIQSITPSDEDASVDRPCFDCENFDDQSRHCSQWKLQVPEEAVQVGCEQWSQLIPF